MDGITVLNSYTTLTNASDIFLIVVWGSVFAVLALGLLYSLIKDKPSILTAIFTITASALAVMFFCNIPAKKLETHYQVIVDDSVSMNEFQSKYEIIEVEGRIYTIRERVD